MKQLSALIASLLITGLIGVAIFAVGANALWNKNTVPLLNAPAGDPPVSAATSTDQAQIQQLQNLINQYRARDQQYQQREQEYQTRLAQAQQQLDQANSQVQQYQSLLIALQNRGVIIIEPDGRILIPRE